MAKTLRKFIVVCQERDNVAKDTYWIILGTAASLIDARQIAVSAERDCDIYETQFVGTSRLVSEWNPK